MSHMWNAVMDTKGKVINLIRIVILFQLDMGATIVGCFSQPNHDSDVKQHIANMMTVITTSTFALYAKEK